MAPWPAPSEDTRPLPPPVGEECHYRLTSFPSPLRRRRPGWPPSAPVGGGASERASGAGAGKVCLCGWLRGWAEEGDGGEEEEEEAGGSFPVAGSRGG